jgi:hypothetical protein
MLSSAAAAALKSEREVTIFAPCYALGDSEVTRERCLHVNRKPQNAALCAGCASPFRQCASCKKQHIEDNQSFVCDASLGLCKFHKTHGADALRKSLVEAAATSAAIETQGKTVAQTETHKTRKHVSHKRPRARQMIMLGGEIPEKELLRMARLLRKKFDGLTRTQQNLIKLYALDQSSVQAAEQLGMSIEAIRRANSDISSLLSLPEFETCSSHDRGKLRQQVIKKIYNLHKTGVNLR